MKTFLGCLLNRPVLSGTIDVKEVKEAIDGWIPHKHGCPSSSLRDYLSLLCMRNVRMTFDLYSRTGQVAARTPDVGRGSARAPNRRLQREGGDQEAPSFFPRWKMDSEGN